MIGSKSYSALVCPLNWGLGHASRCIPVIRELKRQGFQVTIAASGKSLVLLRNEFPELPYFELPGFTPSYSKRGMTIKMLLLLPEFLYYLIIEKYLIAERLKIQHYDLIISDNRYRVFHKSSRNVLIIHQLKILAPGWLKWAEPLLGLINRILISKFDECWIPDFPHPPDLGGILSHPRLMKDHYHFVGPLSRFLNTAPAKNGSGDLLLCILSGPEPQRTILEKKMISQLESFGGAAIIIRGVPGDNRNKQINDHLSVIDHTDTATFLQLLQRSYLVICRSGYSTLMDLASTGGKALFIPTPGQTEQEYLAHYFLESGIALSVRQSDLELTRDIPAALAFKGFSGIPENQTLSDKISSTKAILVRGN